MFFLYSRVVLVFGQFWLRIEMRLLLYFQDCRMILFVFSWIAGL